MKHFKVSYYNTLANVEVETTLCAPSAIEACLALAKEREPRACVGIIKWTSRGYGEFAQKENAHFQTEPRNGTRGFYAEEMPA